MHTPRRRTASKARWNPSTDACPNRVEPLWALHFVDRRVKNAPEEMVETRDKGLVRLIRKREPKLKPKEVVESLGRLEFRIELPVPRPPARGVPRMPRPEPSRPPVDAGVKLRDMIQAGLLGVPLRLFRQYKG